MSQPAPQQGASVSRLPQVVIEEGKFEGEDVQETLLTITSGGRLTPQALPGKDEHRVVTHGDILTVQLDVKVIGVAYETDAKGNLARVQKVRPIEGTATVVDVVRAKDTRIR